MIQLGTILVATDLSETSTAALAYCRALVSELGCHSDAAARGRYRHAEIGEAWWHLPEVQHQAEAAVKMQADAVLILQDRHVLRATAAARTSVEPAETIVAYATDAGIEVSACGRTAAGWRNCCWTASPKASYDPHHLPCLSSNVSGASRSPDRLADPVERFGPARPCPAPNDNVTREVDKSDGDVRIVKEVR